MRLSWPAMQCWQPPGDWLCVLYLITRVHQYSKHVRTPGRPGYTPGLVYDGFVCFLHVGGSCSWLWTVGWTKCRQYGAHSSCCCGNSSERLHV
jgi:hypothetical protein